MPHDTNVRTELDVNGNKVDPKPVEAHQRKNLNTNNHTWRKNIYNSIKDISDIEKQKKLWLGSDKFYCSSYDEMISLLFDSFSFDDFLEEFRLKEENLTLVNELFNLKDMLDSYIKKDKDEDILKDPSWVLITEKANQVIKIWDTIKIYSV